MRDLLVLCADLNARATIEAILSRPRSLQTRPIDFEVRHNPIGADGGTRAHGVSILRAALGSFSHAMMVFDWEGCGASGDPEVIERDLTARLAADWANRALAIVLDPELEAWLVGAHRHFGKVSGVDVADARQWLAEREWWPRQQDKPARPKEALEAWLRAHGARRTSANYRRIMKAASLRVESCRCASFRRFATALRRWFPAQ
ncbi:MAG: hypothetical protein HY744_25635 [Deltaproteobacteria bacterium]|nr:hypothetical protein [Deltaproteobacteria bacterium]